MLKCENRPENPNIANMIQRVSLICGIEILERFAYYGLRSIFILFLVQTVGWDKMQASSFYGTLTGVLIIGPLFAGLLADLTNRPALLTIIGSALAAVGAFGLAFSSGSVMVKTMLIMAALGSALYKPSIISMLYRATWPQKQKFDLVYSIFYFSVNIGAFLGPVIIAWTSESGNPADFRTGFLICGGVSLVVTILLSVFHNTLTNNDISYNNQSFTLSGNSAGTIVLLFIASLIFWSGFELFSIVGRDDQSSSTQLWVAAGSIIASAMIVPLSLFSQFRGAYKIAIGMLLAAGIYLLLFTIGFTGTTPLIVLNIAEMLVAPILLSQVLQHGSPRFTATLAGGIVLMTYLTNKLVSGIISVPESSYGKVMIAWSVLTLAVGAGIFLLDYLRPNNPPRV